jgi:adenylate cyclase
MEQIAMLGELVPCGGGDAIPLLEAKLRIGRRSDCDIVLSFPNVSAQHCFLELINGYWFVRDLHSRNGLKVNGQRCDSKWLLPGDELTIAKHRFEVIYDPVSDAPPPEEEEDPFAISLLEKAGLARREESDRGRRAPAARPIDQEAVAEQFSSEEDQAVDWLTDDSES